MSLPTTRMKKIIVLTASALAMTVMNIPIARADDSSLLQQIATNTYNTYVSVNNIPTYLESLSSLAKAFSDTDDSTTTATVQGQLASYTSQSLQSLTAQNAVTKDTKTNATPIQLQLVTDMFGGDVTTTSVPNANDLTYQSLLGMKYFSPDPRSTGANPTSVDSNYNYIKYAAGLKLFHAVPVASWKGSDGAKQSYANIYDTIMAIESFNAYTLSQLYTDNANNGALSKTQVALLTQASNSDWFSTIASEKIGFVLREILMYNTQMYVLMSQLLTIEKQLLASQAMTNTLLISLNQTNEDLAVKKAIGVVH
ncbi:MAG: hypothetical protein P4M14_09970 [Gammaproteobacteria bacterium]|nr:hypothetical protein [Gammaproteobacteria bacterium]